MEQIQDTKTEIEMETFKLKCQFCSKGEGVIPICDSETLKELWICEDCDTELFKYT